MNTAVGTGDLRKLKRLQDPLRLRIVMTGLTLAIGYVGIYFPLSTRIDETSTTLEKERRRERLTREIEYLQVQHDKCQPHLQHSADTNEWVQYILNGIREHPLTVHALESNEVLRVGPYSVLVLNVKLEGRYQAQDSFLTWLESNERLFRIDAVKLSPSRTDNDQRVMELTVLGLKG